MFAALADVAANLNTSGKKVVALCNDPRELSLAQRLFAPHENGVYNVDQLPKYFDILAQSQAVISGRLHSAAIALSLAKPFLLLNLDQRTAGFVETYQLHHAVISLRATTKTLNQQASDLLTDKHASAWQNSIKRRDELCHLGMQRLRIALTSI
jgi:polysaccharide pyruvyl transferase WcaK-like protein